MVLLEKKSLCILIDSGSTYNFINANIVGKLRCVMEYINELKVLTANGNVLKCKERCRRFPWVMQGQNFVADVLSLPLDNYDLVLGVQWMVELGDIVWNFNKILYKGKGMIFTFSLASPSWILLVTCKLKQWIMAT